MAVGKQTRLGGIYIPATVPRVDTALALLGDRRRRYALYHLRDRGEPVSLDDLAVHVAELEARADATGPGDDLVARVRVGLQHTHLPKAYETGVVEYDADAEVARLAREPPAFDALVAVARARTPDRVARRRRPRGVRSAGVEPPI